MSPKPTKKPAPPSAPQPITVVADTRVPADQAILTSTGADPVVITNLAPAGTCTTCGSAVAPGETCVVDGTISK